jgi:hypothetical protein
MAAPQGISRLALATAFLFSSLIGCTRGTDYSEALIVCPGATKPNWEKLEGTYRQLDYQIEVEYPASSAISCISAQLKDKGWRPLQEDFWNPGHRSSHVRGWMQYVDDTLPRYKATVDLWTAQWENESGDIAWYQLTYRYPPGDRYKLAVHGGVLPANVAKNVKEMPAPLPDIKFRINDSTYPVTGYRSIGSVVGSSQGSPLVRSRRYCNY